MMTMNWLPSPTDFRQSLQLAAAAQAGDERLERLLALAQCRLGFVETIQLDRALTQLDAQLNNQAMVGFNRARVALLASSTIDHLLPAIRVAGLRRRLLIDVYTGSFGQYRQELFDAGSALHQFKPETIVLALGWRELIGEVPLAATPEQAQQALTDAVEGVRALWRQARESLGATVIQHSLMDLTEPLFGSFDRLVPAAPTRLVGCLNELIAQAASQDGALLLDIARASARDGIDCWFDVGRWLQAKIEIAPQAACLYGELLLRLIAARRGQSKKCLVLDLDNTLWGGVIGDVGLEGIVLGEGSGAGEAHLALQRYAKSLSQRGIVLAVCSKNELTLAEEAFRDHPEMLLKRSDIAAFQANWNDKAENLKAIAAALNIGLDSLVFVDDNPAERARIRESLPMVAVPELPSDPAHYVRCIADAGYFEAVAFTEDDRQRVQQYAANSEREALRDRFQSMDDFLRGLDMSVEYGPVTAIGLARATQLINKTNQFNTTTRRFTPEEVSALAGDTRNITLQFRLIDRFGDNGLVSVMILCPPDDEPDVLEVLSWVMSCRVFGRQLEQEAMNIAAETARSRGIRSLRADLVATKKNVVISDLYSNLGFSRVLAPLAQGTSRWTVELVEYAARPTFIHRTVTS